jgi:multiple sugar transport system permease protein
MSPMRRREALTAYLFLTPFLFFFILFIAKAVVQSVYLSFFDYNPLQATHPFVGLQNYKELVNDQLWWQSVVHTAIFAVLTVTGTTILALFAALAVNNPIPGRTFFRAVFYAPGLLSVGVVGITWAWLMDTQFGLINYALSMLGLSKGAINWLGDAGTVLPALSLTTVWWTFGFPMLIFIAGLQNIPDQLYEAARIDGAGRRQVFQFITLPLLRPTILFVTVTGFISHFQVFGQPYIMPSTGAGGPGTASYTVIIYLYQTAWRYLRMGYGSAIAVGLGIIMITLTLIQFRFFGGKPN